MSDNNNELIDQYIKNIDKIIIDRIFNDYCFDDKLKSLITYDYYIWGGERITVEPTKDKIDEFKNVIFKEVYLEVLMKLRSNILGKESIINKIVKNKNIKDEYDKIFLLDNKQLLELLEKYCDNNIYLNLHKKIKDGYDIKEIFYKDNSLYNIVAFNCFKDEIINRIFDEDNPTYKIEINVKNKLLTKLKTAETKKIEDFVNIYNAFKKLLSEKQLNQICYVNKWISFYEINKKYKYINIVVLACYLPEYKEISFESKIDLWKEYILSLKKHISNLEDHIEDENGTKKLMEYRMELISCKISCDYYKEKVEKEEAKFKDILQHRKRVKENLLNARLFIISYLIDNTDILDDLYYKVDTEKVNFLNKLSNQIDNVSMEIFQYIKEKKSLMIELRIIQELNIYLRDVDHKKLFEVDFSSLVKSKQFMDLYDMVNR